MSTNTTSSTSSNAIQDQLAEDPYREPFEKELAVHLEGDGTHFSITSFKKVVYSKLLKHSEFNVKRFHILNDGHEQSVSSLDEVSDSTIIGVTGQLPVGTMSIGTPRNSNSHANIVK